MKIREKMAKLANDEVKNNSLYLWGGQGESVEKTTPAQIQKKETSNANAARVLKCLANKINSGANMKKARYFDCSGLIVDLLRQTEVIPKDADYTAQGIFDKLCDPICKANLKRGDLTFISNGKKITHVGIYDDNGICIEAAGRDLGVVRRGIDKNNWNIYGRVKTDEK